jgi:hypothetical protein
VAIAERRRGLATEMGLSNRVSALAFRKTGRWNQWIQTDLGAFKRAMESQATADAMAFDGVKRETVKMFVLDKEVKVE